MLISAVLTLSALAVSVDPPVDQPADFASDVKLLFQVVTCQDGPLPETLDKKTIDAYCAKQKPRFARFQEHWGAQAMQMLAEVKPKDLPPELVYPFGGGDLMMALASFPEAKVITTLSLELAGDPRRLKKITDINALKNSLQGIMEASNSTLTSNDSKSVNLSKIQRGELPGQLSMHLMGLALFGYVPVSVRYFRVENDGSLHYFTLAEIDALEGAKAERLWHSWSSPDFSPAFANVEVQFVSAKDPSGPVRIHRHFAADLSDAGLAKTPGLLLHLANKGKVATMTKAASYLLWRNDFSQIRDYLTSHATVMLSDSTGVPLKFWKAVGCEATTYGWFKQSFLGANEAYQAELREAYAAQPRRALPMRFGYPDGSADKLNHLIVVACKRDGAAGAAAH